MARTIAQDREEVRRMLNGSRAIQGARIPFRFHADRLSLFVHSSSVSYDGNAYLRHPAAPLGTQVKANITGAFTGDRVKGSISIVARLEAWKCLPRKFAGKWIEVPKIHGGA